MKSKPIRDLACVCVCLMTVISTGIARAQAPVMETVSSELRDRLQKQWLDPEGSVYCLEALRLYTETAPNQAGAVSVLIMGTADLRVKAIYAAASRLSTIDLKAEVAKATKPDLVGIDGSPVLNADAMYAFSDNVIDTLYGNGGISTLETIGKLYDAKNGLRALYELLRAVPASSYRLTTMQLLRACYKADVDRLFRRVKYHFQ